MDCLDGVVGARAGRGRWGNCKLGMWDCEIVLGLLHMSERIRGQVLRHNVDGSFV